MNFDFNEIESDISRVADILDSIKDYRLDDLHGIVEGINSIANKLSDINSSLDEIAKVLKKMNEPKTVKVRMTIKSVHEAYKHIDITQKDSWWTEKHIVKLLAMPSVGDTFQFDRELYKVLKIIQLPLNEEYQALVDTQLELMLD